MKTLKEFIIERLINEGGAAGHMLHPFELDSIWSGEDLINYFTKLNDKLSNKLIDTFVKLDGTNCAVRVRGEEFVLDRLTKNQMDIDGMTVADVAARYGGHEYGYDKHVTTVLNSFNECYSAIKGELDKLGLLDNQNLMLNLEFIPRESSIIDIDKNFIAIHGLLEVETTHTGARKSHEVKSNKTLLEKIAKKMNAKLSDTEVITQEIAVLEKDINIYKCLNRDFTVFFTPESSETHTLKEWLDKYVLTEKKNCSVKTLSGKRVNTQSLQVLRYIHKSGVLSEMFYEKDIDNVLKNFFLYYCTLIIGQEFLNNMNSRIGHLSKQEGLVVRDEELNQTDQPVKLTGFFVLNK